MIPMPYSAVLLAAGLGTRMRPLTEHTPKPLVEVAGQKLIDHALVKLEAAGVRQTVINVHYLADQMETYLKSRHSRTDIIVSDERALLLETGGGVRQALAYLDEKPFFATNSDSFWHETGQPELDRLAKAFDPDRMDMLLLLADPGNSVGHSEKRDFSIDDEGRLSRLPQGATDGFIYAGTGIFKPDLFADCPDGPFSLNLLFDRALEKNRLFGLPMESLWLHVGTVDAVAKVKQKLSFLSTI